LSNAVGFCRSLIAPLPMRQGTLEPEYSAASFVTENADAEVWERMCAIDNPPPLSVVSCVYDKPHDRLDCTGRAMWVTSETGEPLVSLDRSLIGDKLETQHFGNHLGGIVDGLKPGNLRPWCVQRGQGDTVNDELEKLWKNRTEPLPWCPPELEQGTSLASLLSSEGATGERSLRWATRGAMNVGMSVFYYLRGRIDGSLKPQVPVDACGAPN
jgi:hypothetical protein